MANTMTTYVKIVNLNEESFSKVKELFDFKQLLKKNHNTRKECIALPLNAILNSLEKNDN